MSHSHVIIFYYTHIIQGCFIGTREITIFPDAGDATLKDMCKIWLKLNQGKTQLSTDHMHISEKVVL